MSEALQYKCAMESYSSSSEHYCCSEPYESNEAEIAESMDNDEKKKFYARLQKGKVRF